MVLRLACPSQSPRRRTLCARVQGTSADYEGPQSSPSQSPQASSRFRGRRDLASAAIGGSVRFDDEIAVEGGDMAGALFSEETGLSLKPLQQAREPP